MKTEKRQTSRPSRQGFPRLVVFTHTHSLTRSEIQPTSGADVPESTRPTRPREFSLHSLAYILARRFLPDSTLSIAGSSSHGWSQRSTGFGPTRPVVRVGVEGRLQKPGRNADARGEEPNPDPIWVPHAGGEFIFILASLKFRIEATSLLTELRPS